MPKLYINSLLSTLNTRRSGSELMAQTSSTGNGDVPDAKPTWSLRKSLWGTWAATTNTHMEHLREPAVGSGAVAAAAAGPRPLAYPSANGAHAVQVSTVQEKDVHLDPGMLTHPLAPKRSSTDDASSAHIRSDRSTSIHSTRINNADRAPSPTGVMFASQIEHMA